MRDRKEVRYRIGVRPLPRSELAASIFSRFCQMGQDEHENCRLYPFIIGKERVHQGAILPTG